MGSFGDFLNGIPIVGPALAPGKTVNQPFNTAQGAPPPGAQLQPGPNGTMIDPATGQIYTQQGAATGPQSGGGQWGNLLGQASGASHGAGLRAVQAPNVAQQTASDFARATDFFNQVPGYDAREAAAYGQEGQVADYLNGIVHGTGPSVAGAQLATGLEQAQRAQLAAGAGASGGNAALMRMLAMGNTGQLQAQTNQQQAVARAQEQRDALAALAGVTGNMQQQSMGMGAQKISAADAINGLAMQGQSGFEDRNLRAQLGNQASQDSRYKTSLDFTGDALGSFGNGATVKGTM